MRSFGLRLGAVLGGATLFATSSASAQTLAPPPPISSSTPNAQGTQVSPTSDIAFTESSATTSRLDEAEREDSGRKFELFWINGELGGSYIDMSQLSSSSLALEKTSSAGPMVGLGAGVRLVLFVLGARARYNALGTFNMWQLNAEAGLKIPIRSLDFGFGFHGGYSFVGSLADSAVATDPNTPTHADAVKVRGFNAGADVVLDYYLTPLFSLGLGVTGDFLFLNRPALDKPSGLTAEQSAAIDSDPLYQKSGSSAGLQLGAALRVGLHFGL